MPNERVKASWTQGLLLPLLVIATLSLYMAHCAVRKSAELYAGGESRDSSKSRVSVVPHRKTSIEPVRGVKVPSEKIIHKEDIEETIPFQKTERPGQENKNGKKLPNDCPKLVVSSHAGGRLGNQMSSYATLMGVTHQLSAYQPFIPEETLRQMTPLFPTRLTLRPVPAECSHANGRLSRTLLNLRGPISILPSFLASLEGIRNATGDRHLIYLDFFPFSPHVFHPVRDHILREFVFSDSLQSEVSKFLRWVRVVSRSSLLVSVHVRRADYKPNLRMVSLEYFRRAIHTLRKSLTSSQIHADKLVFIVTSDDNYWCKTNFHYLNETILYSSDFKSHAPHTNLRDFDLAVAAACDHAIYDYGTFGFWGAYLQRTPRGSHVVAAGLTGKTVSDWNIRSIEEARIPHWTLIPPYLNVSAAAYNSQTNVKSGWVTYTHPS